MTFSRKARLISAGVAPKERSWKGGTTARRRSRSAVVMEIAPTLATIGESPPAGGGAPSVPLPSETTARSPRPAASTHRGKALAAEERENEGSRIGQRC